MQCREQMLKYYTENGTVTRTILFKLLDEHIETVDLSHQDLSNIDVSGPLAACPALKSLILKQNRTRQKMDMNCISSIAQHCPLISHIDLSGNELTFFSFSHSPHTLYIQPRLERITRLWYNGNGVSASQVVLDSAERMWHNRQCIARHSPELSAIDSPVFIYVRRWAKPVHWH